MSLSRRAFLKSSLVSGAVLGVGDLPVLRQMAPVTAADAAVPPGLVRFRPEIEPIVRLVEETPRERLLEEIAGRIRKGLTYREVLTALLLAGVRNVQPRPYVGFKFHAVLVVNSAHLASLSSPDEHRWLPIFWALDYFKSAQAQDVREGDWIMAAVEEKRVPPPEQTRSAFSAAMDNWDEAAADVAAASLARGGGANATFELLFRYGARDFRSIGHKAIYVANSWRTLSVIGWQHAEPVVRSLAYALLTHQESGNPAKLDAEADRPWRENVERVARVRKGWQRGTHSAEATAALVEAARTGSSTDASKLVVELLNKETSPASIWDAVLKAASDLVLRKPGILSLHAATTANALHFAYRTSGVEETRLLLLLQGASFLPLFREGAISRGGELSDVTLDTIEPLAPVGKGRDAVEEIFAAVSTDRLTAARKALGYLRGGGAAKDLIDAARLLVFLKGDDAHDYKFSSAVLEDYYSLSASVRDRYLAGAAFLLRGAGERDNQLVERVRSAFGKS